MEISNCQPTKPIESIQFFTQADGRIVMVNTSTNAIDPGTMTVSCDVSTPHITFPAPVVSPITYVLATVLGLLAYVIAALIVAKTIVWLFLD